MIRKLRRKFICISMGMVGLVLLTLVCGLLITPASRRTDRSRPSSRTALTRRAADRFSWCN